MSWKAPLSLEKRVDRKNETGGLPSAKRRVAALALVGLLALVGGCVTSKNPLSDPDDSRLDPALCGVWVRGAGKDAEMLIVGKSTVTGHPRGFMRIHEVNYYSTSTTYSHSGDTFFFSSTIGDSSYINLLRASLVDPATKTPIDLNQTRHYERWKSHPERWFVFRKYQIKDDALSVWEMTTDAAAKLVDAGKLKGKVTRDKGGRVESVSLTDSTEDLARFLKGGGDTSLFPASTKKVYKRLK